MIDKIAIVLIYFAVAIYGLVLLPYLLYMAWVHIIALKKKARHLDFDCRG